MNIESNIFKSLSESIRLRIVVLLFSGELCVCDLMSALALPQSTTSRHMAKLKSAGLVTDRRSGKWVYYQLDEGTKAALPELFRFLEQCKTKAPYLEDYENLKKYQSQKECI